jgi:UDP-3-O-[3-hydroxymyristoyl] glucosamine N-acyltransferase
MFPGIQFPSLVSQKAHVGVNVSFGAGNLVMQGCILTCDIKLSDHVQLNINTTVGHDAFLGPYTTTAPGVHINGCVTTGNSVYFGSNSSTVENIWLTDDIVVGAGAAVVKDLVIPGTYVGIPAKYLRSSSK